MKKWYLPAGISLLVIIGLVIAAHYGLNNYEELASKSRTLRSDLRSQAKTSQLLTETAPVAAPPIEPAPTPMVAVNASPDNPVLVPQGAPESTPQVVAVTPPSSLQSESNEVRSPAIIADPTLAAIPVPQEILTPSQVGGSEREEDKFRSRAYRPGRYLLRNTSPEAFKPPGNASSGKPSGGINPLTYAPPGELLHLVISGSPSTTESEVPITAFLVRPFEFQGRTLAPNNTKVLGTISAGKKRDKARITFNRFIFTNGKSLSIQAVGLDLNRSIGVTGTRKGQYFSAAAAPLASDVMKGMLDYFSRQGESTSQFAGIQTTTQEKQGFSDALGQSAAAGGSRALDRVGDILMEEFEDYRPFVQINQDTRCVGLLLAGVDVSRANYE